MKNTTFQRYKNWSFIFQMCVSLEPTTVANNAASHLNAGAIYMIFYAIVIMQSGQYPFLIIKSNQHIMASIGLYLLKELTQNTQVHHTTPVHFWHHIICHVRHYCILFCLMTANRTPQPHLNTLNALLSCCKAEQYVLLT